MTAVPAVLLPFQRAWLTDRSRVKVFEKSRRIGATWATAADSVLEAASGRQDIWYVSYNETSAKEFVRDAAVWCKWFDVPAKHLGCVLLPVDDEGDPKGVRAFQIAFPSGKRITALTSSARNLRGKQGRVIIDEAAFHDDLPNLMELSRNAASGRMPGRICNDKDAVENPAPLKGAVNPYNPCLPYTDSRTCERHPSLANPYFPFDASTPFYLVLN